MPNNYSSNINPKLLRAFAKGMDSQMVLKQTVGSQLVNDFDRSTGGEVGAVRMKRKPRYVVQRTTDGDMSGKPKNPIIVGSIPAEVGKFMTLFLENAQVEEALETDQLEELIQPVYEAFAVQAEADLASFMNRNAAGLSGDIDVAISEWQSVANTGAYFKEIGATSGRKYCAINSFDSAVLAGKTTDLGVNPEVGNAYSEAVIKQNYGGMTVLQTNALEEYESGNTARSTSITVKTTPSADYATYKDSMQMSIVLTGGAEGKTIKAGETLTFASSLILNLNNRKVVKKGQDGVPITLTVLEDVAFDASKDATVKVSGAAIKDGSGDGVSNAFDTVSKAIAIGDAVKINGTINKTYRPSIAYCDGFVGMGSVVLPKLHAQESNVVNFNGISIRVTKGSDITMGTNQYRFDHLPTFACYNPFLGIQVGG